MVCSVGTGTVAEYYLNEQAEYYTGGKEPQGHWYCPGGAFDLQDGNSINSSTFKNLHSGLSPDGVPLGQFNQSFKSERVGGYDLTFSAPKSISVLWAVSDEDVRAAIEKAQDIASRAALDTLQEHASYCRRGKGGATLEKVEFIGATFQHGEARPTERGDGSIASDPQLHTHSVIFNVAKREDATWGALDGRHFYKWKMTAGAIYRARLAHELQETLGVDIEVKQNGLFEVAGVPESVRTHFSSRRSMIDEELTARGLKTKDAQALASAVTKTSRRAKSSIDETVDARHTRWKHESEVLGLTEKTLSACMNKDEDKSPLSDNLQKTFEEIVKAIPRQLTEHEAVFRLETLYRAAAEAALESGESTEDIKQAVASMMDEGSVVEIGHDEIGLPLYSTQEMIQIEEDLVRIAQRSQVSKDHQLHSGRVEKSLQLSNLTEEQQGAVRFVTGGSDVAVMEGAAGAGKTHALRTVSTAYQEVGYRVIGTSTAWRMANQLGDDLAIEAKATDAWLAQEKSGKPFMDAKTVLIVDEAGQLSSWQMLKVLQSAEDAQAKVILTGDQKQLQAIGAGPGLRLVAEQTGVARIDTIIRQREAWAREAVENFSLGRAIKAIEAFEKRDALKWCADGKEAVQEAIADWKAFKAVNTEKTALVMAKTNKQVRELNAEMRDHLREKGHVRGEDQIIKAVDNSGRSYDLPIAIGEQIMFKKRNDELGVINGTTGTITRIEQNGLKISAKVQGRSIEFKTSDIVDDTGRVPLAHGYASTIYSAQGATIDTAYIVVDQGLKKNEIYVAASRARDDCKIYVDSENVEKTVRSQLPLSDKFRVVIPKEQLRQQLSKSWSQAQIKNSTRDYQSSKQEIVKVNQSQIKQKVRMPLPKIELA